MAISQAVAGKRAGRIHRAGAQEGLADKFVFTDRWFDRQWIGRRMPSGRPNTAASELTLPSAAVVRPRQVLQLAGAEDSLVLDACIPGLFGWMHRLCRGAR